VAGNELAHAQAGEHAVEHAGIGEEAHHEAVYAPDQLKPSPFLRIARLAAVVVAAGFVVMAFVGNHRGNVEKVFLVGIAALMILWLIMDFFLKKAGLKND